MTKLLALGGLGALGAGTVAAVRAKRRTAAKNYVDSFDFGDLDEPVVVTEEVVVVTEAGPYEIDMELIPVEDVTNNQSQAQSDPSFDMPGRGSAPR